MASLSTLKQEIDEIKTLQYISQAFTEASAAKIRSIKETFEKNRAFYEEVSHLYDLVEYNANLLPAPTAIATQVEPEEHKIISIAVTSNQRFYGSINVNIMQTFIKDIERGHSDLLVIGATGIDFMRTSGFSGPFEQLQFSKDLPTDEDLRIVLEKIKPYHTVFLFYPKFVTLLSQTVAKIDITHREANQKDIAEDEVHIIFEPEIREMITFFDQQVRTSLFLRVMLETDLARTAARLLSMTSAEDNASQLLKEQLVVMRKLRSSILNTEQLEKFSGMKVWKKGKKQ